MRFYRLLLVFVLVIATAAIILPASAQDTVVEEPAEECVPMAPDGWVGYSVKSGDTLSAIAAQTGTTVAQLQQANCIRNARQIRVAQRLYVPDDPAFLRRCLVAGYETEECRRIYNAYYGEDNDVAERCQAAGLTTEECRRAMNGEDGQGLTERCRAVGLTTAECRLLVDDETDVVTDVPQQDQIQDRLRIDEPDQDRIQDRLHDQVDEPDQTRDQDRTNSSQHR